MGLVLQCRDHNGISLLNGENHKYESIYGMDIGFALRAYLRLSNKVTIRFINDAAAFAAGEAWVGKSKRMRKSVSITLGTGLGSGFINDGIPIFSGENIPPDGFVYNLPFKNSIADDCFSTRGLVNNYFIHTRNKAKGVKEIAADAKQNMLAMKVFMDFGEELATFLSPYLTQFESEALIVGGSISKSFNLFSSSMQAVFDKSNPNLIVDKSELNELAPIFGSARLINNDFWEKIVL